jgi:hypothetical protein
VKETILLNRFLIIVNGQASCISEGHSMADHHPDVQQGGADDPRARLTQSQRRYLSRGLSQPGGKLPLFDEDGRQVPRQTVEACIAHGWAEAWFANPIKPDWLVCKLTPTGYRILGHEPPASVASPTESSR